MKKSKRLLKIKHNVIFVLPHIVYHEMYMIYMELSCVLCSSVRLSIRTQIIVIRIEQDNKTVSVTSTQLCYNVVFILVSIQRNYMFVWLFSALRIYLICI